MNNLIWWQVGLAIAIVLISVLWLRLHALLALLAAALVVALMTPQAALQAYAEAAVGDGTMTVQQASAFVSSVAPQRLATAFGKTAGNVGILIALASIVGICLMESGAARTIIDRVLTTVGNRRAPEALAVSSFFLGIPVFFDTVFYLMVPLARSLRRTLGKDYVLFILAILAGGSLAHSLIPPTPGPLQVADTIGVDVVTMMLVGLVVGACSSLLSLPAARLINRWVEVPLRPIGDEDADADDELAGAGPGELGAGPPFWWSLLPILLPVLLIASRTAWDLLVKSSMPASGAGRGDRSFDRGRRWPVDGDGQRLRSFHCSRR